MENDEKELRQVTCDEESSDNVDGCQEAPVHAADAMVKGKTRDAAQQKCRRVDYVGDEIEDFCQCDDVHGQDISDVDEVAARSKVDEVNA